MTFQWNPLVSISLSSEYLLPVKLVIKTSQTSFQSLIGHYHKVWWSRILNHN